MIGAFDSVGVSAPDEMARVAATENLFVLATRPGEETLLCGGLIAEACARGRPPVVAVLTDGSGLGAAAAAGADRAAARERATRAATAALGLPRERLFLFGLLDGSAPAPGDALFERVVAAVTFLMWSRDCGTIVAPIVAPVGLAGRLDHQGAEAVAGAVARRTGVRLLRYPAGGAAQAWPHALRLEVRPNAKWRAMTAHAGVGLAWPSAAAAGPEFYVHGDPVAPGLLKPFPTP